MEVSTARKSEWVLTSEAFEHLLRLLDADREIAGDRYELARRRLTEFFEARGSQSPSEHADETLTRAARRLAEGEPVADINKYLYGVARLLLLEWVRSRERNVIALERVAPPAMPSIEDLEEEEQQRQQREHRFECFEKCLEKLPGESRDFIVTYYKEEKGLKIEGRKSQAEALGVSLNALRLRATRIRSTLERCVGECLNRATEKGNRDSVTNE